MAWGREGRRRRRKGEGGVGDGEREGDRVRDGERGGGGRGGREKTDHDRKKTHAGVARSAHTRRGGHPAAETRLARGPPETSRLVCLPIRCPSPSHPPAEGGHRRRDLVGRDLPGGRHRRRAIGPGLTSRPVPITSPQHPHARPRLVPQATAVTSTRSPRAAPVTAQHRLGPARGREGPARLRPPGGRSARAPRARRAQYHII